ncbi:MAG: transglutaminase-like domain-containing protein [Armatimonadota bacterium]|nr:transglutaminase-like domain-containing protein [bacterium]
MRRNPTAFLTFMLIMIAARAGAFDIPYESWMGSYVGDKKIGYMSYKIDNAEFEGTKGYRIASVLSNRLTVLGADLTQLVTTVVYTDTNYAPLREDFTVSSGGKSTTIRAIFHKNTIDCVVSAGSGVSSQSVSIPDGMSLVGDAMFVMPDAKLDVGNKYTMHYFNPLTLAIEDLNVTVDRRENITVHGKEYGTVVLTNSTPMGEMTIWQDKDGDCIQLEAVMGIRMLKETQQEATSELNSAASEDFAVRTSVKPDREISDPRNLEQLDILFTGLGKEMAISDDRQKAAQIDGEPGKVQVRIKASSFDAGKSILLPVDQKQFSDQLASTVYLDWDNSAVREQAQAIVGTEANAYRACAKIREWVHANMIVDKTIGISRSASDVIKSKRGVCRDYGILFASLARAAGIPSRIAAGLLYTEGAFYYHVWAECWVGEWVPFDATLPVDFVDATHVKLAEGDAPTMFGLAKVIGSLKAEIK